MSDKPEPLTSLQHRLIQELKERYPRQVQDRSAIMRSVRRYTQRVARP